MVAQKNNFLISIKLLLGIPLAFVIIAGSAPLGFSESLRSQLDNGLEIDELQCDNPNHVLALRSNGNPACASERTVDRMGWEIIETKSVPVEPVATEPESEPVETVAPENTKEISLSEKNKEFCKVVDCDENGEPIRGEKIHKEERTIEPTKEEPIRKTFVEYNTPESIPQSIIDENFIWMKDRPGYKVVWSPLELYRLLTQSF